MSDGPSTVHRRLSPLDRTDVWQLVVLAFQLARIEISLKRRTIPDVASTFGVKFLHSGPTRPTATDANIRYTTEEWRWVKNQKRIVKRWPWDKSCLRRSLLLGWVLRRRGPELVIGTRLDEHQQIAAHAWICLEGVALDIEALKYTPF